MKIGRFVTSRSEIAAWRVDHDNISGRPNESCHQRLKNARGEGRTLPSASFLLQLAFDQEAHARAHHANDFVYFSRCKSIALFQSPDDISIESAPVSAVIHSNMEVLLRDRRIARTISVLFSA